MGTFSMAVRRLENILNVYYKKRIVDCSSERENTCARNCRPLRGAVAAS